MRNVFLAFVAILFGMTSNVAQDLNKTWQFDAIENTSGKALFSISDTDSLSLKNGEFSYFLGAKDNLEASGDYIHQNNLLVFYYIKPTDTIRRYKISELTDSTLVFSENNVAYKFKTKQTSSQNSIINSWQLSEHVVYEKFPDKVSHSLEFTKGKEFLNLMDNGEYISINKNNFQKGYWIQNNNLIVFKQKVPSNVDVYYQVVSQNNNSIKLKNGNEVLTYISENHPNFIEKETSSDTIIPSEGFSINSLWRGALGMITLVFIAFLFSSNRKAINWKVVGIGLSFQLLIAIGVLKVSFIKSIFEWVGSLFVSVLDFTRAGSEFLFSGVMDVNSYGFIFAFQVLPTILFFSALTSVLFYLGIIQKVVKAMAWLLSKVLKISGAESLSVAGNIFLGQTEAPLLIKAYLEKMNKSEILLVMIGGMATVAGAVLAAYIGFLGGEDEALRLFYAKHLLAASVMAAPGAIVISKILFPQTEDVNTDVRVSQEKIGANILDAIANGTTEGLRLAVNVGAMLLVFVAFIAMLNGILGWVGDVTTLNDTIAANTYYLMKVYL